MHFDFSPEQKSLKRAARAFLSEHSTSEKVRKAMVSPLGYDPEVWRLIGTEMGWPALIIPEEYGGAGGTYVDLAAVMEECGYFLLCSPLFSTVCLATNWILSRGTDEQKREWLTRVASGETTATFAWDNENEDELIAKRSAGGFVLTGKKNFVPDGGSADVAIVFALVEGKKGAFFLVSGDSPGLTRTPHVTVDGTRRQATLTFNEVFVPESRRMSDGQGACFPRAWGMLASEQVGGAQRCLDMAVDYAKTRQQFGRAIGSFQAIKHQCADMAMRIESARSAAYYAAWSASEEPDELETASRNAKVFCSETYFHCASENIQIHGGVGFTWEHDAHLYFKRARSSEVLLGEPSFHRRRIAGKLAGQ